MNLAYVARHRSPQSRLTMRSLGRNDILLDIRQQPKEALVSQEGKGKRTATARKPVDPPPIIQLRVKEESDPGKHYLQNPYLFMCCSLLVNGQQEDEPQQASKLIGGTLVSSLHRLKDVNNEGWYQGLHKQHSWKWLTDRADGGFFVFGDLYIKLLGQHTLNFSLFELDKNQQTVIFLTSIVSEPFQVNSMKDWHGLEESTVLSRTFSDQGVRLRLRKEPRGVMAGTKRTLTQYATTSPMQVAQTTTAMGTAPQGNFDYGATTSAAHNQWLDSPLKRLKHEDSGEYDYIPQIRELPYRQMPGYDPRNIMQQQQQGRHAEYGEASHYSRALPQVSYPYANQQASGPMFPIVSQAQSYPAPREGGYRDAVSGDMWEQGWPEQGGTEWRDPQGPPHYHNR
ncbi:MAG: hypothetical protein M1820_004370 [Bogoriella megaspora]|nr:MAG: hypothetical protein M1820_004370 [Bogoriella megaspora]